VLNDDGPVFWVVAVVGACAIFCFFYCIVKSVQTATILRKNRNLRIDDLNKANRAKEVELALQKLGEQAVADANKTAEEVKLSEGQEKPLVEEPDREELVDLFYPNDADYATIAGKRNILDPHAHYNDTAHENANRYNTRKS